MLEKSARYPTTPPTNRRHDSRDGSNFRFRRVGAMFGCVIAAIELSGPHGGDTTLAMAQKQGLAPPALPASRRPRQKCGGGCES